jgi:hypothetical protein
LTDALHHQGDVDSASYAAVPYLLEYARRNPKLDWYVFALLFTIELSRPQPPPEIPEGYYRAIEELPIMVCSHPDRVRDDLLTKVVVSYIALAHG